MRNNGFIEIEEEESSDETGWSDVKTFGRVYKLPAKGVVLDFISQSVPPALPEFAGEY